MCLNYIYFQNNMENKGDATYTFLNSVRTNKDVALCKAQ